MNTCIARRRLSTTGVGTSYFALPKGFGTPVAAMFYWASIHQADDTMAGIGSFYTGIAFAGNAGTSGSGVTARSNGAGFAGTSGTSRTYQTSLQSGLLYQTDGFGVTSRVVDFVSFDVDKINYNYRLPFSTPTEAIDCIITVWTGSELSVACNHILCGANSGTAATVTNLTFQPQVVIGSFGQNAVGGAVGGQLQLGAALDLNGSGTLITTRNSGFGLANGGGSRVCTAMMMEDGLAHGLRNVALNKMQVSQFNAGGFNVLTTGANAGGAYNIIYLALGGIGTQNISLGTIITPINSGAGQAQTYNVGFVPQLIIGGMTHTPDANIGTEQSAGNADNASFYSCKGFDFRKYDGTGTVTCSTVGTSLTGNGTSFLNELCPNDLIFDVNGAQAGTISSITSQTSANFTDNASINLVAARFQYEEEYQYSVTFGADDGLAATTLNAQFCSIGTSAITAATASGAGATNNLIARIGDFNKGTNDFTIVYNTLNNIAASGTAGRAGWYLAFKETPRRRVQIR